MSTPGVSALRLLILSPTTTVAPSSYQDETPVTTVPSPFPPFLTALTSTSPSTDLASFTGYTAHPPLHLETRYYTQDVGIWCDELPPVALPRRKGTGASSASGLDPISPIITLKDDTLDGPGPAVVESTPVVAQSGVLLSPTSPYKPSTTQLSIPQSPSRTTKTTVLASATPITPENPEPPTLKEYKTQFLSPEAQEVLASIGAIVLILPIPSSLDYPSTPAEKVSLMEYMSAVNEIKDAIEDVDGGRDVASVFLLQPTIPLPSPSPSNEDAQTEERQNERKKVVKRLDGLVELFEDKCHEMGVFGWDFVAWDGIPPPPPPPSSPPETQASAPENKKKQSRPVNLFGEKAGIARIREVLEAVDWSASPSFSNPNIEDPDNETTNLGDGDDDFDVFTSTKYHGLDTELQQEMMGLKLSMLGTQGSTDQNDVDMDDSNKVPDLSQEGEDMSIDQMSALMERVVAIREAGAEMGKEERANFAKREVERIMREIS